MGHLHCSVIDSDDAEAFIRNGNSFGKNFGGQHLSFRDFGTYEIAPPPGEFKQYVKLYLINTSFVIDCFGEIVTCFRIDLGG